MKFTSLFTCLVLLGLAACTPQQKLNNLIARHPELAKAQVRDTVLTVIERDTLFIPERSIDTFFSVDVDTFVVTDSGVTVTVTKYLDKWHIKTVVSRDTIIYSDTVKIAYKDTINVFNVQPISGAQKWHYMKQGALWSWIIALIIFLIYIAIRIYLKGQIPFLR